MVFCKRPVNDGTTPIDYNLAEREVKPFVIGRNLPIRIKEHRAA